MSKKTPEQISLAEEKALPSQPLNRLRLLEVIRDTLKTADGRAGIATVIATTEYIDEAGTDLPDQILQTNIFKYVKDGDERAIVRRFFSNLEE